MPQYIYLLHEREFIKTNENIYKLGKTKQEHNNFLKKCPKGSKLLIQIKCDNCDITRNNLIKYFNNKYTNRRDIGNEYFEGDMDDMKDTICQHVISEYKNKKNEISNIN